MPPDTLKVETATHARKLDCVLQEKSESFQLATARHIIELELC